MTGATRPASGRLGHNVAQNRKTLRIDDVVVGGRVNELAGRRRDALIHGVRTHEIFPIGDDANARKIAREHFDGTVPRGVVDDDDFIGNQIASIHRLEKGAHLLAPVVRHDDDADARPAHTSLTRSIVTPRFPAAAFGSKIVKAMMTRQIAARPSETAIPNSNDRCGQNSKITSPPFGLGNPPRVCISVCDDVRQRHPALGGDPAIVERVGEDQIIAAGAIAHRSGSFVENANGPGRSKRRRLEPRARNNDRLHPRAGVGNRNVAAVLQGEFMKAAI